VGRCPARHADDQRVSEWRQHLRTSDGLVLSRDGAAFAVKGAYARRYLHVTSVAFCTSQDVLRRARTFLRLEPNLLAVE
jgi:hypothetical protein